MSRNASTALLSAGAPSGRLPSTVSTRRDFAGLVSPPRRRPRLATAVASPQAAPPRVRAAVEPRPAPAATRRPAQAQLPTSRPPQQGRSTRTAAASPAGSYRRPCTPSELSTSLGPSPLAGAPSILASERGGVVEPELVCETGYGGAGGISLLVTEVLGLLANNGAMASINSSVADAGDRLSQDVVAGRSGVLTCSPPVSEGHHLT
jgi:hypothetical protein